MSGLGELGEFYNFNHDNGQVQQRDIDQYDNMTILYPSVDNTWFGTVNGGTAGTNTAFTLKNALADTPRNAQYACTGVSGGTFGGTFIANWIDQFGSPVTETVVVPSAANGGSIYGTAIVFKFLSGTFQSQGSSGGSAGTALIGVGTKSNGSAQSNWFGLMCRIGGTSDVKQITWKNNGTHTTLNAGTNFGTLVGYNNNGSLPSNVFQGTSGVQITDVLNAVFKTRYDNTFKGTMCAL